MTGEEMITEEEAKEILEDFNKKKSEGNIFLCENYHLKKEFLFKNVLKNNTKKRYDSCIQLK